MFGREESFRVCICLCYRNFAVRLLALTLISVTLTVFGDFLSPSQQIMAECLKKTITALKHNISISSFEPSCSWFCNLCREKQL
jgi:hypothetical protein